MHFRKTYFKYKSYKVEDDYQISYLNFELRAHFGFNKTQVNFFR